MPGKFEACANEDLARELFDITLDGFANDDFGDVEENGAFSLILDFNGRSYITMEDSQGLFKYWEYDSAEDAEREFRAHTE